MRDSTNPDKSPLWIIVGFTAATLLIHLLTNSRYGYFRDELYYIACSRHLAAGYVDLAPLSAWVLRLETLLFGDSLFALRLFPATAGAMTVALTGALAHELGGRVWAVALGCAASASALAYLGIGNFYSMNAYEPLFWTGCVYLLVRIINGASPWLWLGFGAVAGLGVENKHSLVFFAGALTFAILVTADRREFAKPWIWLGGALAFVLALPNLVWQVQHGWPTYELLHNVAISGKNVVLGPAEFTSQQVLIMNPATLPLWLGGLIWLVWFPRYRSLGIAYLLTLGAFIAMHAKHYYLAPIYPMLFAAGGVAFEQVFARRWRWVNPAIAAAMLAIGAVLAPVILPIFPPENLLSYMRAIHFHPPRTETAHTAALPQLFADQFGWEEMVGSFARAYQHLTPDEQARVGIYCQNYGQAGAIDFFGPKYGLPPAISGHQNYFYWGPRGYTGELLLVIDTPNGEEREQFESVEDLGLIESSPWAMPWQQRSHLYLCRGLKGDLRDFWPKLKNWL
ncbi:MAG: glycosyltransferase family 39 protein [Verrucomicrobiota bacterium]|nr:glycosyltransferase family 39 protein [Verrucomicrobiota bacterium]